MEGYIVNNSGKSKHIFKRKFPVGHKIFLEDIWGMYEAKVCESLDKKNAEISEEDFVNWLGSNKKLPRGFEVVYASNGDNKDVVSSTSADASESLGKAADGRLERPSLAGARQGIIDALTYKDVANLKIMDNPKEVVDRINNLSKLRRAYTTVRNMPRKRKLENILRNRIQELERIS